MKIDLQIYSVYSSQFLYKEYKWYQTLIDNTLTINNESINNRFDTISITDHGELLAYTYLKKGKLKKEV